MGGRVTRGPDLAAADLGGPAGYWNSATLLRPLPPGDPARVDAVLGRIEAFYGAAGTGELLLWSAWPTPDLLQRGWRLEGHPLLLLRPAGTAPEVSSEARLRIEPVADAAGVRDFERVTVEGYPLPELQPLRQGSLFDARVLADRRIRM